MIILLMNNYWEIFYLSIDSMSITVAIYDDNYPSKYINNLSIGKRHLIFVFNIDIDTSMSLFQSNSISITPEQSKNNQKRLKFREELRQTQKDRKFTAVRK